MNDCLVFSQPAHVVAYLLEGLLAGPAAGSRRRKGGEKGLDLGQLLGGAGGLDLGQLGGALSGATA